MDEKTRRQITWIVLIGALACLIVWGVGRANTINRLQDALRYGTPQEQIEATRELVDARLLTEALQDQPRWVQENAVSAIPSLGTSQAWFQLAAAWHLLDAPVQTRATNLLIDTGNSGIPTLVEALKSKNADTRKGVPGVLTGIGEPAIPYMLPLMDAWDDYIRTGAAVVLGGIGEPAADEMIAIIKRGGPDAAREQTDEEYLRERETAQNALVRMKAAAFEPIASELLTAESSDVRGIGATLLGTIANQTIASPLAPEEAAEVVEPLLERLQNDTAWSVRRKAATSMGLLGSVAREEGAVQPVIRVLQDQTVHPEVRTAVAESLGRFGDPAAAAPMVQVLMSNGAGVQNQIVQSLIRLGKPSVAPLSTAVASNDPNVRLLAVQALAHIPGTESVKNLAVVLGNSTSDKVRRPAAEALRNSAAANLQTMADVAVPPLVEALYDDDWRVYYAARDALGKCGTTAIEPLLGVLGSEDVRAAYMAQQALVNIGKPAVPKLIGAIKMADARPRLAEWASLALGDLGYDVVHKVGAVATDTTQPGDVRIAAIRALGHTRSSDAISTLQDAFEGADPAIQIATIDAVDKIGSEDGTALLMGALRSASTRVADGAMRILSKWPHVNIEDLSKLLRSDDEMLQDRAAVVLTAQGTGAAASPLGSIGAVREDETLERNRDTIGKLLARTATDENATGVLRTQSIEALGDLAYEPGLEQLGQLIRSRSDYAGVAATAVARIGVKASRMAEQGAIVEISEAGKLLIEILMDTDSDEIRLKAAVALSLMQKSPVDTLIEQLKEAPEGLKPWIAATLGGIGKFATDAVANERDRVTDEDFRDWLAVALACIGDAQALHEIKWMPKDQQPAEKMADTLKEAQALTTQIRLQKK